MVTHSFFDQPDEMLYPSAGCCALVAACFPQYAHYCPLTTIPLHRRQQRKCGGGSGAIPPQCRYIALPLACNNQLLPFTSDYSKKKGEHFCKASEQRRKKRKTAFYSVPSKQHTCCCSCLLLYISISMDYLLSLIMKEGKLEGFPWDLKVIVFENFVVILCL